MNPLAKLRGLWGVKKTDWARFDKAFEVEEAVKKGREVAKTRHQTTAKRGPGRPKGSKNKKTLAREERTAAHPHRGQAVQPLYPITGQYPEERDLDW